MSDNTEQVKVTEKTVERLPLMWAVVITVWFSLPFGTFFGNWNFTLWVSFIVWAQYFVLGANFQTWKLIFPSIPYGAGIGVLWCSAAVLVDNIFRFSLQGFWGLMLMTPIFISTFIYLIPKVKAWQNGSLAVFNGYTMFLAVYFSGSLPQAGPMDNPYWVIIFSFIWTIAMCLFGWFLGWLNVTLTFPKKVKVNE